MKLNTKVLALASAASVVFWLTMSNVLMMVIPMNFLQLVLSKVPVHIISVMLLNGIITFTAVFLVVFTAAFLYNRWTR